MPIMPKLTPLRIAVGVVVAPVLLLATAWLVLFALATWCLPQFEREDLVGVYTAKCPSGTETLTFKADGTFLQEFTLKEPRNGTPITGTGSWTWDESSQRLRMDNCWGIGNCRHNPHDVGRCDTGADRKWLFFGQLLLGDRDSGPLWKVD